MELPDTSPVAVEDFSAGVESVAEFLEPEVSSEQPTARPTEHAEVAVKSIQRKRSAGRRLPKIAALVVGPVIGCVMGLYGLLWLQGEQADYVGMSRVLPASLLPPGFGEGSGSSQLAAASPPVEEEPAENDSSLAAARELMSKPSEPSTEPPAPIKRDEDVLPAGAVKPMPEATSTARITADEFSALVDAATAAAPEFMTGDLSTSESIKRKGQAYMDLCRLAEHFDFARHPGIAPNAQAKAEQAVQLFQRVARESHVRQDLAHIAGRWWEYDKRPTSGIFLSGRVEATDLVGTSNICWVKLDTQTTAAAIPVWVKRGRFQPGESIGVVGRVLTDGGQLPQGLSEPQVVACEYAYRLP